MAHSFYQYGADYDSHVQAWREHVLGNSFFIAHIQPLCLEFAPSHCFDDAPFNAAVELKLAGILSSADSRMAEASPGCRDWRIRESENQRLSTIVSKVRTKRRSDTYRQVHVDEVRERNREYNKNNLLILKNNQIDYYERHKAGIVEKTKTWKTGPANAEKLRGQRQRANENEYHRPFVMIDAEGRSYKEGPHADTKIVGGVEYHNHKTIIWGAGGWKRKYSSAQLKKDSALPRNEGEELPFTWLEYADERPLKSGDIVDWLLSLPSVYGEGKVNFVSFAFNYDATQIFTGYGLNRFEYVKEIATKKSRKTKKTIKSPTLCGPYVYDYLKGKWLKIWELRDPDKPYKDKIRNGKVVFHKRTGKPDHELDFIRHITIHDAFGFYQSKFTEVIKPLIKTGYVSQADYDLIEKNKAHRGEFETTPFPEIQQYCGLELITGSKALTVLRDGFDQMKISLKSWSGAGSAAAELIKKHRLKKEHYFDTIKTLYPRDEQIAAHHAYYGGRIELLKQGYAPDKPLFGYDISSAYPSGMLDLPSMKGGEFLSVRRPVYLNSSTSLQWIEDKIIAPKNILSMFKVKWCFPRFTPDNKFVPFYPFPYRTPRKGILFPQNGYAWLMKEDVLAGIAWIKTFWPSHKAQKASGMIFEIEEYYEFCPANEVKPYAFVQELYDQRQQIKAEEKNGAAYNILEKAIKLCINSLYGKTAQNVGGNDGEPPSSACPWYAAAITANCRMRLLLAALHAPFDICMFATDGILSTAELKGLPRVIELNDKGEPVDSSKKVGLGDWEFNRLKGGGFLQSGVYFLIQFNGKVKERSRGTRSSSFANGWNMQTFFEEKVLPGWRREWDIENLPEADLRFKQYITVGNAIASQERYGIMGRWGMVDKRVSIHKLGLKRRLLQYLEDEDAPYLTMSRTIAGPFKGETTFIEALRCHDLIPTLPAENVDKDGEPRFTLSLQASVGWLEDPEDCTDDKIWKEFLDSETNDILAGFE